MNLRLDANLANNYKSFSQRARILTENWVKTFIFCPACGSNTIKQYAHNRPVADFYCDSCQEEYELKSKQGRIVSRIVDGAYHTMLKRLDSSTNPNLFFLSYDLTTLEVSNFIAIPKYFFVPQIIEKRAPLSATARRAGWVGCHILLNQVPLTGKIYFIRSRQIESKEKILECWQKTKFLRELEEVSTRRWLLDVMLCIEKLGKSDFTLSDIYLFEDDFSKRHPKNKHIKDKIRQQLQLLRDKSYIEFTARGHYKLV